MIDVATEGVSSQAAEAAGDTLGGATGVAEQLPAALLATSAEAFTNGLPAAAAITVGHLPPGTSKWNKIEHRMFFPITMNWHGPPLETHEIVVETIAATTTKTGLTIQAALDTNTYQRGIKITDKGDEGLRGPPPATTRVPRQLELHRARQASRRHDTPGRAEVIYL